MDSVGSVMFFIILLFLLPVLAIFIPFEYILNFIGWFAGALTLLMIYVVYSDGDYGFRYQLKWIIPALVCAARFGLGYLLEGKNIVDIWRMIAGLWEYI